MLLRFIAIAILVVLAPMAASAGTTGMIAGTVYDESNHRPLQNALVTEYSPAQVESVRTDALGRYRFMSLAPGLYYVHTDARPLGGPTLCAYASADGVTQVDPPYSPFVT